MTARYRYLVEIDLPDEDDHPPAPLHLARAVADGLLPQLSEAVWASIVLPPQGDEDYRAARSGTET